MNKQELKEQIQRLSIAQNGLSYDKGNVSGVGPSHKIGTFKALRLINQLYEPKKVVVPKFVAEHIEYLRGINSPMRDLYNIAWLDNDQLVQWLYNEPGADDLLGRAWLDGYVVEREKLYTVEIPNPNNTSKNVMVLRRLETGIELTRSNSQIYRDSEHCQLTESEIRQDFDWAWQAGFAKEVG